ncbi:hypothetical protein [Paenibacillus hamazuiensis]|uniref:hypothetical protein n=1 Tax=Paenibacillus hamazuiensis TaxID=2936508 RepID=UPI002010AA14|nr:hypothetical protein [Paenibacillus hamazuiensis]
MKIMKAIMEITESTSLERLESAVEQFEGLASDEPEISAAYSEVMEQLHRAVSQCHDLTADTDHNEEDISEIRKNLASVRQKVRDCHPALEKAKTDCAEEYRAILGEQKDAFEKLAESEQQTSNPKAYAALQTFYKLTRLEELASEISAELMDLSGDLEHQKLQQHDTPPIGHYDAESSDPAQPSLSP